MISRSFNPHRPLMPELRHDLPARAMHAVNDPAPCRNRIAVQHGKRDLIKTCIAQGGRMIDANPLGHDQSDATFGPALIIASNIVPRDAAGRKIRSEEHTSELQSLMRISYAV